MRRNQNKQLQKRKKRNILKSWLRGCGTISRSPVVRNSTMTSIRIPNRIETRKMTYVYQLISGTAGNLDFYIGTTIPGVVPNSAGTALLNDLNSADEPQVPSFQIYRITYVEIILSPLENDTALPITMYAAYTPDLVPITNTSPFIISDITGIQNHTAVFLRRPQQFGYKIKRVSNIAKSATLNILEGGWVDTTALLTAPVNTIANMGPGYIALGALTSSLGVGKAQLTLNYVVEFNGRDNV